MHCLNGMGGWVDGWMDGWVPAVLCQYLFSLVLRALAPPNEHFLAPAWQLRACVCSSVRPLFDHLFVYMYRHVSFDLELRLRKPVLGDDCPDVGRGGTAVYRLVATVSHHGKHAAGASRMPLCCGRTLWWHERMRNAMMERTLCMLHEEPTMRGGCAHKLPRVAQTNHPAWPSVL